MLPRRGKDQHSPQSCFPTRGGNLNPSSQRPLLAGQGLFAQMNAAQSAKMLPSVKAEPSVVGDAAAPAAPGSSGGAPTAMTYADLAPSSLFAAKVENGLQTGAIYWETNMNPFNGAFGQGTYGQKWSWQLFDDSVRKMFGLDEDTRNCPMVFHNDEVFDRTWVRDYNATDRNFYQLVPAKKKWNFSFFPTGTKNPLECKQEGDISRADVFTGVLASCLKVDLAHAMA
ncbi:unnamed protein product [Amoebophrya sp. A120]|nr:unnamed protein product [Amoebophrya sp. A120]|eukprot:GSA120T00020692001.1